MKITVLLLLAMGVLQAGSFGQTPPSPPTPNSTDVEARVRREEATRVEQERIHSKWNVCVDVQMVAMDEAKALDLMPDLQSDDEVKMEAAWTKIQVMIKVKDATLLGWPMVRAVDGDRSCLWNPSWRKDIRRNLSLPKSQRPVSFHPLRRRLLPTSQRSRAHPGRI